MNTKYKKIYEPITLPNGVTLPNRFAVAPMSIEGADITGAPTKEDINFWERRADTAALLITGETSVSLYGMTSEHQLGIFDSNFESWKKLAQAMKSKGNKAIVQLFHGGYKGKTSYQKLGAAYGPSNLDESVMGYSISALTDEQIHELIYEFGHATELLIDAGFDGLELSANFYMLYSFFSRYFNRRTDKWGKESLATRSALDLAILDEIEKVVKQKNAKDFIIGVRFRPEDLAVTRNMSQVEHGEINHTLDDTIYLINEMLKRHIDYIHSMGWGGSGAYKKQEKLGSQHRNISLTLKKAINGRVPLIVNGGIINADEMLDSLNYGDIFSIGTLAIVEPDAKNKIFEDQELNYQIQKDAALPKRLSYRADSFAAANPVIAKSNPQLLNENSTDASTGASQNK